MAVETRDQPSPFQSGFAAFSAQIAGRRLRPCQVEAANAIIASTEGGLGETFVVMMARQMGKKDRMSILTSTLATSARWQQQPTPQP